MRRPPTRVVQPTAAFAAVVLLFLGSFVVSADARGRVSAVSAQAEPTPSSFSPDSRSGEGKEETRSSIRTQLRWIGDQGRFVAHGNALAMVGDTLLLDRLIMYREGFSSQPDTAWSPRVHLPDMDRIAITAGSQGHARQGAVVGGLVGLGLAAAFMAASSGDPFVGPSSSSAVLAGLAGGTVVGGLLGAGIGAMIRTGGWQRVDADRLRRLLGEPFP